MGLVIKGVLTGLTPSEKLYLITHPHHIGIIQEDAHKALAEARVRYPGAGQHNGSGDAFRHCYWSSLLARDIGGDNALEFTTAHEAYSDNPAGERAMDLHNNRVGVSVGVSMSGATDAQLANRCATLVTTGVLVTAPPSPGATYNY